MIKASLNYYRACNCTLLVLSRKAFLRKESLFELIQSVRSLFDRTVNSVARIAVSYMAYLYWCLYDVWWAYAIRIERSMNWLPIVWMSSGEPNVWISYSRRYVWSVIPVQTSNRWVVIPAKLLMNYPRVNIYSREILIEKLLFPRNYGSIIPLWTYIPAKLIQQVILYYRKGVFTLSWIDASWQWQARLTFSELIAPSNFSETKQ